MRWVKYNVCLSVELMSPVFIETKTGDWIDDPSRLSRFRFRGIKYNDPIQFAHWCSEKVDVDFSGDLDDPLKFRRIYLVRFAGPESCEYTDLGLCLQNVSIFTQVEAKRGLNFQVFEDLFHLIRFELIHDGYRLSFGDYRNYSASIEKPIKTCRISTKSWINPTDISN